MTEYESNARAFLEKANTTMRVIKICTVDGFPNDPRDKMKHNKYKVVLTRNEKTYDFDFYGSYRDYLDDRKPSVYDILACVEKYEYPTDPWEFAREFGYDIECEEDYNRVRRIADECREQYEKLLDLFGEELMEELCEIN